MTISHAATTKKTWAFRTGIAGIAAATLAVSGIAIAANAEGSGFKVYDETDSPNPGYFQDHGVDKLAFFKGADIGWQTATALDDVTGLGYTVTGGTTYAPSYQLVVTADRDGGTNKYTRLVWEPYMQAGSLDADNGTYTDLEDGVWWTNRIADPAAGSQSDPQPLSFFTDAAGANWTNVNVFAFAIHQGTTTDSTSYVTSVTFGGEDVPVSNSDATPFAQSDIEAATAPLVSALNAYKANHHLKDGTSIGTSSATLSGTPTVGKKLGVKLSGNITKATGVKYQWYVSGVAVKGATKSTFTVPKSAKKHTVTVRVTGTYNYVTFGVQSNGAVAK
jgi:hypothetical protein